jgi:hypothetical protein
VSDGTYITQRLRDHYVGVRLPPNFLVKGIQHESRLLSFTHPSVDGSAGGVFWQDGPGDLRQTLDCRRVIAFMADRYQLILQP